MELIASTKQVERKSLHMFIQDLKERLMDGKISSYQLILTGSMLADAKTKETTFEKSKLWIEG